MAEREVVQREVHHDGAGPPPDGRGTNVGVLIGVLVAIAVAILIAVLLFGGSDDNGGDTVNEGDTIEAPDVEAPDVEAPDEVDVNVDDAGDGGGEAEG